MRFKIMILSLLIASAALAQFEDFEENPVPPPPPPPPLNESNSGGAPPPSPTPTGLPSGSAKIIPGKPFDPKAVQRDRLSQAGIEDITTENFPETIESFDFPNADIQDIVKAMSELTGKNFIIDPGVRGKITIIAPSKISVAEAYKAFLSALAINGYAVVPSGKFLKIRSARYAQRDGIETYAGSYYPNSDQMITRIIHLKHISADIVNRELRILISKDGEISPYTPTNSLIISDYGANIERISRIISQLDVQGFEDQLEVLQIRYAKSKDIAELINKIINKGEPARGGSGGTFSAGTPRFSRGATSGSQGGSYFLVIPDDRTNALIIVGNKAGIERVKKLVGQLDFRMRPEDSGGVYVYYCRHGEAKKIAQTLSGIAKDGGPKPSTGGGAGGAPPISPTSGIQTVQEIFGGDVKITADEGTNSLVVVASKQDYDVVLNLLRKIDIARDQVFVEAIIMEMSLADNFNWDIATIQYNEGGYGKIGFVGMDSAKLSSILNPIDGAGAILGWTDKKTVKVNIPNTSGTATSVELPSLLSFVNFLKKNANANVLSTPQLLALDNQEAKITVSDKIVTNTTTTIGNANTPSTESPVLEDAKIELKIKPFISLTSNSIRMELEAEVGQIGNTPIPSALAGKVQPLARRQIKTNIVVPNKHTAVLGGLMKETDVEKIQKVPLLGDIPILGWLFKSRQTEKAKANLLIFLTPRIIRTADDHQNLLAKKLDQRLDYIKSVGGKDPFGKHVEALQNNAKEAKAPKKAAPPVEDPVELEVE